MTKDYAKTHFQYGQMPTYLLPVCRPLHDLAFGLLQTTPGNTKQMIALRLLVWAKGAAARAFAIAIRLGQKKDRCLTVGTGLTPPP